MILQNWFNSALFKLLLFATMIHVLKYPKKNFFIRNLLSEIFCSQEIIQSKRLFNHLINTIECYRLNNIFFTLWVVFQGHYLEESRGQWTLLYFRVCQSSQVIFQISHKSYKNLSDFINTETNNCANKLLVINNICLKIGIKTFWKWYTFIIKEYFWEFKNWYVGIKIYQLLLLCAQKNNKNNISTTKRTLFRTPKEILKWSPWSS